MSAINISLSKACTYLCIIKWNLCVHVQLQMTYGKSATLPNISPDPSVSSGPNWTERPGTLSGTLLQDKKIQSRMLEKQMQKEKVICFGFIN